MWKALAHAQWLHLTQNFLDLGKWLHETKLAMKQRGTIAAFGNIKPEKAFIGLFQAFFSQLPIIVPNN